MSTILPASTVVLIRDGQQGVEVLLLRRNREVSFASGSWVFPGGKIDRPDYGEDLDDIFYAAEQAAVRETAEEAGLDIAHLELHYFSHWTTPPHFKKRFATWFFIADITGLEAEVEVDGSEIVGHQWYKPAEALADHHSKQIEMMAPTYVTLSELSKPQSSAEAIEALTRNPAIEFEPRLTKTDKGIAMLYTGDAGYETHDQGANGPRHRVWLIDETWRYEKDD